MFSLINKQSIYKFITQIKTIKFDIIRSFDLAENRHHEYDILKRHTFMGLYWIASCFLIAGCKGGYPPIKSLSYIILYVNITIETNNYTQNPFHPPLFFWDPYWGTILHTEKNILRCLHQTRN